MEERQLLPPKTVTRFQPRVHLPVALYPRIEETPNKAQHLLLLFIDLPHLLMFLVLPKEALLLPLKSQPPRITPVVVEAPRLIINPECLERILHLLNLHQRDHLLPKTRHQSFQPPLNQVPKVILPSQISLVLPFKPDPLLTQLLILRLRYDSLIVILEFHSINNPNLSCITD